MKNPLSRISLLWKILLSTSVAITLLFAVTGWIAVNSAARATSSSVEHAVAVEVPRRPAGFDQLDSQRHVRRSGGLRLG
jgi:hypothetical protein